MRKLFLAAIVGCCAFTPAVADDFTGFYLGVGFGGTSMVEKLTVPALDGIGIDGAGGDGVFGRVSVGADRQFGNLVVGAFADFDFSNSCTDLTLSGVGLGDPSVCMDNKWTVGARLGYADIVPSTMLYVLAGYTQADFSGPAADGNLSFGTHAGWTVGGGVEARLSGNLFGTLEYRFSQFDGNNIASGDLAKATALDFEPRVHDFAVGLKYKIGGTPEPLK